MTTMKVLASKNKTQENVVKQIMLYESSGKVPAASEASSIVLSHLDLTELKIVCVCVHLVIAALCEVIRKRKVTESRGFINGSLSHRVSGSLVYVPLASSKDCFDSALITTLIYTTEKCHQKINL